MRIHTLFLYTGLLTVFLFARSSACAQTPELKGFINGLGNTPIVFSYEFNGERRSDTVYATNDRFIYQPQPSDDGRISLRIARPSYTSFWYQPGHLDVSGSMEKPHQLVFKGGEENELNTEYEQTINWAFDDRMQGKSATERQSLEKEKQKETLQFIGKHPGNQTSAYLLYWQALTNEAATEAHETLWTKLSPEVRGSFCGKKAGERIEIIKNQPRPGLLSPNFVIPDTAGLAVALAEYRGRYVLLDFWGHWCAPCIKAIPKLKVLRETYGDKLAIIGIAAEFASDKEIWRQTIDKYSMDWIQLSELTGDRGTVIDRYNVTAFPTYLLMDKQGMILERTSELGGIEKRLSTLGEL
ncbi:TlpA family protein disulfide reductase [Salmonirosea aquatica]|uniref:Redoxin domain-containing protein n=1 Tax=Salmonirosea aquatica TaxID=2654236 RepID=A0A7C9FPR8_9BACT|nr:redoxin domain-containing protein [Cytophagaceae bacterium SJW1-29]